MRRGLCGRASPECRAHSCGMFYGTLAERSHAHELATGVADSTAALLSVGYPNSRGEAEDRWPSLHVSAHARTRSRSDSGFISARGGASRRFHAGEWKCCCAVSCCVHAIFRRSWLPISTVRSCHLRDELRAQRIISGFQVGHEKGGTSGVSFAMNSEP